MRLYIYVYLVYLVLSILGTLYIYVYLVLSVLSALGSMNEGKFCEEVAGDSWVEGIMAFMPPLSAHLGRKLPCFMDIGLGTWRERERGHNRNWGIL